MSHKKDQSVPSHKCPKFPKVSHVFHVCQQFAKSLPKGPERCKCCKCPRCPTWRKVPEAPRVPSVSSVSQVTPGVRLNEIVNFCYPEYPLCHPYTTIYTLILYRYATRLGPAQRIRVSMVILQRPSRWTPSNKGWV